MRFDSDSSFNSSISDQLYLTKIWGKNLTLENIDNITINGMTAATASSRVNTRSGMRDFRLIAIRHSNNLIYRFLFITSPNQTENFNEEFRRTTFSFKRLSKAEAKNIKPRRIKIVTVKTGDTIEKLANQMVFEDFKVERFRVLNGLQIEQPLALGQRVKIVSY